ncbi:membrane protein DedA with SNARE-associated domain [Mesorhizobium sp. J18]|uniref:DedA family protein n=1 Tax=Mesorhizobium sp. J18 TaxID=935263 RepID=UPI00119A4750|nr:DedA family protein [Mesorhizobium sp. J18]TWG91106.1 membrane protein DedA with SNARE-associated domain [Mesorhizobium sp. J18]
MIDIIHHLIERFGLIAVFLGCIAEGESAAVLGGFFAHQGLFATWQVLVAAFAGSFLGDVLFFLAGKYFSDSSFVRELRGKPAFDYACRMVQKYPAPYVLLNRYIYGFRLIGGVVAGLSHISLAKFLVLNALAALVWAFLFIGIGYVFGLGAEQLIGAELARHERLLCGLVLSLIIAGTRWCSIRKFNRTLAQAES